MTEELWKPLDDVPGYEISSHGRVRSHKWGRPHILSQVPKKSGNPMCMLSHNGRGIALNVAKTVASYFIRELETREIVVHKDGNKRNNRVENLVITTLQDLLKDISDRAQHGACAFSPADVMAIRTRFCNDGDTLGQLAEDYGVSRSTVSRVVRGDSYRRIGGPIRNEIQLKLSDEDVARLRNDRMSGMSLSQLARKYGVDQSHVSYISRGKRRTAAGGPIENVDFTL